MNPSPSTRDPAARRGEYRVPANPSLGECRSCHAPIIWVRTSKNGKPIPLSAATLRTDEQGQQWALNHFVDCPDAAQHRRAESPVAPNPLQGDNAVRIDLIDLPAYMRARNLIVTHSTITDNGNGVLTVELFTCRIT